MEKFFHLKENGTSVSTEVMAGLTTFFAMSYIIVVNPQILSQTGMPWGGVFLATIIAAIIGTLVMGLFAKDVYKRQRVARPHAARHLRHHTLQAHARAAPCADHHGDSEINRE